MAAKKIKTKKDPKQPTVFTAGTWVGFVLLLVTVMSTATGVVYTTHKSRYLLNELLQLESQRNQLQVEWGQLLLEQSSLVSQGRVEDIAIAQLGMEIPVMEQVVVITSD